MFEPRAARCIGLQITGEDPALVLLSLRTRIVGLLVTVGLVLVGLVA